MASREYGVRSPEKEQRKRPHRPASPGGRGEQTHGPHANLGKSETRNGEQTALTPRRENPKSETRNRGANGPHPQAEKSEIRNPKPGSKRPSPPAPLPEYGARGDRTSSLIPHPSALIAHRSSLIAHRSSLSPIAQPAPLPEYGARGDRTSSFPALTPHPNRHTPWAASRAMPPAVAFSAADWAASPPPASRRNASLAP